MLQRKISVLKDGIARVVYSSKDGLTKKTFDALDWLASLVVHVPANTNNWSDTSGIVPANPGACARRLTTTMSSYR